MFSQLEFDPLISPVLWAAFALLAAVVLARYAWKRPPSVYRRRWAGIVALMAAGTLLPLVILLNPTWRVTIPPPAGKPILSVLVDLSASMSATDVAGGSSRYQAAAAIAKACTHELSEQFDVQTFGFSSHLLAADAETLHDNEPRGESTDLALAISEAVANDTAASQTLLLLSDGIHNAEGGTSSVLAALSAARAAAVPIYTKTLGGDVEIDDLALQLSTPQQLAFIEQSVPLSVKVRKVGRAPSKVTLVLEQDDKEISRQQVTLSADGQAQTRFLVRQDTPGVFRYEVRVEPFDGEISQVNNFATFLLRVVDKPIRVLLLEGKPYWDAKFLVRTLLSDPSIELVSVVRVAEGRLVERTIGRQRPAEGTPLNGSEQTGRDPASETSPPAAESWKILTQPSQVLGDVQALRSYQVIVLGRDADVFLSDDALENLRQWLSRDSGSLVCYRGQPTNRVSQRLGRLLPVEWSPSPETRARVELTDSGRELRWFEAIGDDASGDLLPHLQSLAIGHAEKPKPLATVLASAVGSSQDDHLPVISFQPYGGGRVVVVEGAGMWHWAFLPPAYSEHHEVYAALWQSLLRWLVSGAGLLPGQKLALKADRVTFRTDEPASATLLVRDELDLHQVTVELTAEGGQVKTYQPAPTGDEPGTFRVVFGELPEGRYQASVAGVSDGRSEMATAFDVRRYSDEQLDLNARPDLMGRIVQSTGGAALEGDDPPTIARQFSSRLAGSRAEQVRHLSAWDRWWVLVGAFGLWTATWMLRRHSGLV